MSITPSYFSSCTFIPLGSVCSKIYADNELLNTDFI